MAVSPDAAQSLIKELYLMGRAMRAVLLDPEEGRLLPGGVGVLGALEVEGSCRQVELAALLCISPSVLSRHVAELAGAGYISRHADPGDGRATLIRITSEGHELLDRVRTARARGLQVALVDWNEDDAQRVHHAVQQLRNALSAYTHHAVPSRQRLGSPQSQEVDVQFS